MAEPIKPIYKKWNSEAQAWQWGLAPKDFMRVAAGYGCSRCLEPFEFWVARCPVCKLEQPGFDVNDDAPSEWRN
jgi:hypothetical protein